MLGASVKRFAAVAALLALVDLPGACVKQRAADAHGEGSVSGETVEAVLQKHTHHLMSLPGVVGTAIGECEGKPCIKVLVVKKTPELMRKIPATLEGFPVAIEETGEIRALDST